MKWRGISLNSGDTADTAELETAPSSLRDKLLEIKAGIVQYVRPENQTINKRAVSEIKASGIEQRVLFVGAKAPEFILNDQHGRPVSSVELLAKDKLVINFYRGRWCPFCMTELEAWRDLLPQIEAVGASLVAISPQTMKHGSFTADQHKSRFPVLSDSGNQVARQFGLVYKVPEYQRELYKAVFINLQLLNGDDSGELPLPATYVLDREGTVIFASANADYTLRSEPEEVMALL